jgi:lysophospholipase L1-like esterase
MNSICIFGDSTAWGAWDLKKGGWVSRLWLYIAEKTDGETEVYNLSISGGTTQTILDRFESEAKIRNADAIIIQTGGNDAAYENKEENFLIPPEKFFYNLNEIIEKAKRISPNVIVMGLKNCDEKKTMPVFWRNIYYTNTNLQKYEELMRVVCLNNDVPFLRLKPLNNEDFDDGLHPNARGHEKVFEQVRDFLIEMRWI